VRTTHGNRDNVAQDCREDDRGSCTESDRDSVKVRSRVRGGRKDNRKQEGRERKGIRTKTEYVESVDHGLNPSNNSSLLNKRDKDRVRERDKEKEREREREREKEKEISIIEAEIEKEKEIQRAYRLVNKLERRLSTSSIICKKEKVEQKSYASGTPAQESFMPFFSSSVAGTLQQQEHQQKEDLHTEHQMHQQHLLEQHARQQRLMQQQLEDLQLQQQQKQMRLQKKRESRATIPGAPNITRPTFVTLSSKPPRDPSSLMSTCRYGIGPGLGSVLGGRQDNEADTVQSDDMTAYSTYSVGALQSAQKQREVAESGLDLGRRISDWLSNTAGTPGIVGPNCSEAQCHVVRSRSKSAERNQFDNDVASISALLESPLSSPTGTPRGASKRGWGMDVTDDAEAEAAMAKMIADRDMEGGRKGEHDGTWTQTQADTSHLHLPLHHHVIEKHDDRPAVLQSEAQAAACSTGYSQRHQAHLRSKGQTNSTVVSEIDSDRECAYINVKSSRSSGVGRGSRADGRGSVACSTALLGQELERLSQQCSPIGQGSLSGPLSGSVSGVDLVTRSVSRLGSGLGLGLGEGLHVRDEREQSAFCQRLASRRSSSRSPLSTLIPSLTKRDKLKTKYSNDTKVQREAGERQSELAASRAGHAPMLIDGGSISGFGAVDRKRVTQPVSPKFSKMSWQKERGKGLDEWEGPGQGCSHRQEGSVRDRSLSGGPSAVRRGAGTPLLKPTQGMMTRHGQLGVGFGTCNTIDSASISGSCSGAGNGYGSGHAGVTGRVISVGGVDADDKIHDPKKEEGRFGRSISSSVASTRHVQRQVDIERGRGRGSASTSGGQDRGLVGVRAALHSTSHLKYQSNATNVLRSRK
jgi:hypothetical protein